MNEASAELLARFGGRFALRQEYSGGEGRTLRVAPTDGGDELVLKVLPAGIEPAEAALLLSLQHPAIPAVREVGRLADGRAFVLRDHVAGEALRALPADPGELTRMLQQLLEVLAYVHLRGVLHLDLKPGNLVVDATGALHLLDFGLGVRRGAAGRGGTPFFAAPEQLLGLVPDARADLFAVGAMVVHALRPPDRAALAAFLDRFPAVDFLTAAGVAAADLPEPFGAFAARCVAREPSRRFADAQEALELLAGGSGRPSVALLVPDPTSLYAAELRDAAGGDGDVVLRGGSPAERRALALHLAATLRDVRAVDDREHEVRVRRGRGAPRDVVLPPLDAARLLPHLHQAFGLDGEPAAAAARWLLAESARRSLPVADVLLGLVRDALVVPSGTRWTWPAARSGRLTASEPGASERLPPTPAAVHDAAARGERERAIALWQHGSGARSADEPLLRRALAAGLLDGGEPAQALPFTRGEPVLRAQALFDTGQVHAAEAELERAAAVPDADAARVRRLRARIAMAKGAPAVAVELLQHGDATLADRVTLAAALERCGRLDASEAMLRRAAAQLSPEHQPFAAASARTVLGHVLRARGELAAAREQFEAAAALLFRLGHVRHAATAQLNLGVLAKDLGDHDRALAHLREARTMFVHVGDEAQAAQAAANLGIVALARGDANAAVPWLEQGAAALDRLGESAKATLAQAMLARAHAELGDLAAARALVERVGAPASARVREELARVHELLHRSTPAPPTANDPDVSSSSASGPSRELFRTLLAVNRQLAQETDVDKAMRHLLDAAVTLSGGRVGYLLVQRADGVRREFESGDGGPAGQAFSRSLANRAISLQRTLTGGDALADRDLQEAPSIRNLEVRSAVCAPFRSAGGTAGAIYVEHPGRAGAFVDADKEALEMLADQAAIAVDRMLREEALAQQLDASRRELAVVRRSSRRGATALLGDSAPMRELRAAIDKLARQELSVLILGETGTGKELVARALHERSHRHKGPFVAENCAALPAELMERELFGHVKGAFTGADQDRPGLLELASGGTLFLDEVGDMPPALQSKLLRALQEQTIRRVGATDTIALDLRLVAATHRDVRAMVARGEFREDLFFRLAAVELRVPPLRERPGDAVLLARHFVQRHAEAHGRSLRLSPAVEQALADHPWPGNVRELEHVIARAALLCDGDSIEDAQLPLAPAVPAGGGDAGAGDGATPIVTLKEAERRAIVAALQRCGGDKANTARALGISRTALYEKIKRHGLQSP
jgi:transcriptional regulator with GAF, ATPase, and Fis domain